MDNENKGMIPFLKWAGGKRWLIQKYEKIFPECFNQYYEPFVGGGAVFFSLMPKYAILSDINEEIINLYLVMRDWPSELRKAMQNHQRHHSKEYYYHIRAKNCSNNIARAARTLYLNRACFNGLYRVNRSGKFNVPIGTKTNFIYDVNFFENYSEVLKNTVIGTSDFDVTISHSKKNDLIFVDPPYVSTRNVDGFIKYNEVLFTWNDQERLLQALVAAKERGSKIVATNADYIEIKEMYIKENFTVREIQRSSTIAGSSTKRGVVKELLITS